MGISKKKTKTYNTRDSLVVTHPTTSLAVAGLSRGERTGSRVFQCLWSYVLLWWGRIDYIPDQIVLSLCEQREKSCQFIRTLLECLLLIPPLHTEKSQIFSFFAGNTTRWHHLNLLEKEGVQCAWTWSNQKKKSASGSRMSRDRVGLS